MVNGKKPHEVFWSSPSPLWAGELPAIKIDEFRRPAILRFARDDFMDEFTLILQKDPAQLQALVAQFETWEKPMAPLFSGVLAQAVQALSCPARKLERKRTIKKRDKGSSQDSTGVDDKILKLFQPAHQRFYLVSGCLLCRPTGLGDHTLDSSLQERVGFVVRRLVNPDATTAGGPPAGGDWSGWDEQAFVGNGKECGWRTMGAADSAQALKIDEEEERLPLFPTSFTEDSGKKRRLLTGMIPVGRREVYAAAPKIEDSADNLPVAVRTTPKTARMRLFQKKVAGPWERLIEQAEVVKNLDENGYPTWDEDSTPDNLETFTALRYQILVSSWYILLDFAEYLNTYLSDFYTKVIVASGGEGALTTDAEKRLYRVLAGTSFPNQQVGVSSLLGALRTIIAPTTVQNLETITATYPSNNVNPSITWPSFKFPLADPEDDLSFDTELTAPAYSGSTNEDAVKIDEEIIDDPKIDDATQTALSAVRRLTQFVVIALPTESNIPVPPPPLASQKIADIREGYYCIRFVFERPLCGPLQKPVVSQRSRVFRMGGFFDPQAPARPIRIGLPIDTTPAGLRKFDKNTAFMISSTLCGQIKRFKKMTFGDMVLSVLPWPFHKDLPDASGGPCQKGGIDIGMICSLSIPIVTICAFILLIVIVLLLDFVFKWLPYFILCFPVKNMGSKGGQE